MSNDLNQCQFIGRLGQDPEIRYLPNGDAVANIRIAVGKAWKDKQTGQKQEQTTWVTVVAFKRRAEIIGEYLRKGSQIYVSGELRVRKWQDQSGNDRYSTEIVAQSLQMLGGNGNGNNQGQQAAAPQSAPAPQPQSAPGFDDFDDDIPFDVAYRGMELMV